LLLTLGGVALGAALWLFVWPAVKPMLFPEPGVNANQGDQPATRVATTTQPAKAEQPKAVKQPADQTQGLEPVALVKKHKEGQPKPAKSNGKPEARPERTKTKPQQSTKTASAKAAGNGDYTAQLKKGKRLLKKFKLKGAVAALKKALEINPKGTDAMVALAQTYYERGPRFYNPALKWAWEAVKVDPNQASAHLLLGSVYQELGKLKLAKIAYRSFLRIRPTGPMAAEIRMILRNLQ
jgi:tetratricopeptide (TPR) repeat protein